MSVLGNFVREELIRQGISQSELERRSDVPDATIGRIISGEVEEPKPSQIAHLAKGLGITFWRLMQIAGYTNETPGDPDEEAQRLAVSLQSRPILREILREAEALSPEEQDAALAYMVVLRQRRKKKPTRRRRKAPPSAPEEQ